MNLILRKVLFTVLFFISFHQKGYLQGKDNISNLFENLKSAPDSLKPKIYSKIGFYYFTRDLLDSSLYYSNRSLDLSIRLNRQVDIANAYNNIGNLYRVRSDFTTALENYRKALDIYESINDYSGVGRVHGNMGVGYGEQMQFDKAIENNILASFFFKKARDTFSLITSYINLVNAYSFLNKPVDSRQYLDTALALFKIKKSSTSLSQEDMGKAGYYSSYLNKTLALQLQGEKKFDSAIVLYKNEIEAASKGNGAMNMVDLMKGLSECFIGKRQFDSAFVYLNSAVDILKTDSIAESYKNIYRTMATAYEKQGKFGEALKYFQLYKDISDSIVNTKNITAINAIQTRYETKKKDQQIIQLGREKKAQRLITGVTLIAALIATVLMVFAFRSVKFQKKLFRQKEEMVIKEREIETARLREKMTELEQMALRAQMNPHFIFNSLNSVQHFVMNKDVEGVNKYLSAFAHLIRQTLNNSGKPVISLDEEIKYLDTYLSLEKMKTNDRFSYSIDVDKNIDRSATFIPGMILQPYVENSIRHGVSAKENNDGQIKIHISKNGKLLCHIEDNGIGREKAGEIKQLSGDPGYESRGMDITRNRIDTINKMYGVSIAVSVNDIKDSHGKSAGTSVDIEFPPDLE